ncbi:MAG: M48 family metalloprotease [bacterium JZ-2024 1]
MRAYLFGNTLKTMGIFGVMILLLLLIGGVVGGGEGLLFAVIFSAMSTLVMFFFSDKIALAMHGAKPAGESEYRGLHRIVQEIATNAGLPKPRVYIVPMAVPNAFATGRSPGSSSVAVTEGILNVLDERELRGVIGHEMAHIQHRDILVVTLAAIVAGAIYMLARWAQWMGFWGVGRDRRRGGMDMILLLLIAVFAPIAALLLQMWVSRTREYMADAQGARLARDPLSLASALKKLHAYNLRQPMMTSPAFHSLYIVSSFRGIESIFSTHPPVEERIRRLEELAMKMDYFG